MGVTKMRQMIGSGGTPSPQQANGAPGSDLAAMTSMTPTSPMEQRGAVTRWKMWVVSLFGLYPLVLGFLAFLAPHVARWPLPARAALFPFVLLTLMTYVILPVLTRLMGRWLSGAVPSVPRFQNLD